MALSFEFFIALTLFLLVSVPPLLAYLTYQFLPKLFLSLTSRYMITIVLRMKEKFIDVKDFTFCYYERQWAPCGDNRQPVSVLFLHGYTAEKTHWVGMVKFLPQHWRLILVDMPGHGRTSYKAKDDNTRKGYTEKINRFVEALQLKDFHLVGMSMGAVISATYATLYPEKLKSLTLMSMPCLETLPGGQGTDAWKQAEREGPSSRLLLSENEQEYKEMIELLTYNPSALMPHRRMRKTLVELAKPHYEHLVQLRTDVIVGTDPKELAREMASKITMPTLVAWGNEDKFCHPAGAAVLGSIIKGSKVVMFTECGHLIMLEKPTKCANVLEKFIRCVA